MLDSVRRQKVLHDKKANGWYRLLVIELDLEYPEEGREQGLRVMQEVVIEPRHKSFDRFVL